MKKQFILSLFLLVRRFDLNFLLGFMALLLVFFMVGCGGGGGGGEANHAPVISNLRFSPTSATFRQGGGSVTVTGYIDFTDSGGDLSIGRLTSPAAGVDITIPITGISGQTSGTIYGVFNVSTESIGTYTFEVWVIDSKGNNSNKLSGTFEIKIDDTGTQWTTRTSGTTASLMDMTWSGTQFLAVGYTGTILTSPDGINWTQRTSGTSNALWGVTWSGTQFVAVGEYGTILTSPDGISWTQRDSGIPDSTLYDVSWSGTQFVAVGGEFRFPGNPVYNNTLILTSLDGITWTKRTSGLSNRTLNGITWSGTQFIAVSGSELQPADTIILSSSDGINWTQRTIVAETPYTLFDIVWTGSQFVVVGSQGMIFTSSDGINWVSMSSGATGMNLYGVTWSGNNLIAVGLGGIIITSPDGINWSSRTSGTGNSLWGITWSDIQYVAVGVSGTILTSP